jgi:hypothetical protein
MSQVSSVLSVPKPLALTDIVRYTSQQCTDILAQRNVSWRTQDIKGQVPTIEVVSKVSGETLARIVDGDSNDRELFVANWCVKYNGVPSPLLTDAQQTRERIEALERHSASLEAKLSQLMALLPKTSSAAPEPPVPVAAETKPDGDSGQALGAQPSKPVVAAGPTVDQVDDPAEDERQKVADAMAALAPTAPVIVQPDGADDEDVVVEKRLSGKRK